MKENKGEQPEQERLKHKFYIVQETGIGNLQVWSKDQYDKYILRAVRFGGGSAYKIVIGFNGDENYLAQPSKVQEKEIEELKKEVEKWKDEYGAMERIISDYQVTDQKLKNSIESARELIFQYWRKEHPGIPPYRIQDEWELFKSENNL